MGKGDTANHKKARAYVNAKVKARSLAHPNTLPCVVCGHVWRKGERRHEYDHTHDYNDPKNWGRVESVCTTCHHERTEKRDGVQAVDGNEAERKLGGITGKGFMPGQSGNPGGMPKEKREFLESLRTEDSAEVYAAMMDLVRLRNPQAVIRAWEYIVGKPKEHIEVTSTIVHAQLIVAITRLKQELAHDPALLEIALSAIAGESGGGRTDGDAAGPRHAVAAGGGAVEPDPLEAVAASVGVPRTDG